MKQSNFNNMKRITKIFIYLTILTGLLTACQDEFSKSQAIVENEVRSGGRKVRSEISIVPMENQPATKSVYAGSETEVRNWTLLQFDGELPGGEGRLVAAYYQNSSSNISNIVMRPDHKYNFYAVANLGNISTAFTVGKDNGTRESAMVTWEARDYSDDSPKGITMDNVTALPMSWHAAGIKFTAAQIREGARLDVSMTRLVGRYDIVVNQSSLSKWSFRTTSLNLYTPSRVVPFSTNGAVKMVRVAGDRASSADLTAMNQGEAVHFYPLENCYGNLLPSGTATNQKTEEAVVAADATATPTYIEVGGVLTLTDGSDQTKGVTYRFYLGDGDAAATRNFDVIRNKQHTVTLMLTDAAADGDPYWKVEPEPFSDTRHIQFEGHVAGSDYVIPVESGSQKAQGVIRTVGASPNEQPSNFQYLIELAQNLKDAGVKVQVGGSDYVYGTPTDVSTLTIVAPAGLSFMTGNIRIKTLDGAKYDDATVSVGKGLLSVKVFPVMDIESSANNYPGLDRSVLMYNDASFASGLSVDAATDVTFYRRSRSSINTLVGMGFRIFAFYTDGTYEEITDVYGELSGTGTTKTSTVSGNTLSVSVATGSSEGFVVENIDNTRTTTSGVSYYKFVETAAYSGSYKYHVGAVTVAATFTKDGTTKTGSTIFTFANTVLNFNIVTPVAIRRDAAQNEPWLLYHDGSAGQMTAIATMFDGTEADITSDVEWSLDNTTYAHQIFTFDNTTPGKLHVTGLLTNRSSGSESDNQTIYATLRKESALLAPGLNTSDIMTNINGHVYVRTNGIRVEPETINLDEFYQKGHDVRVIVYGEFSDGLDQPVVVTRVEDLSRVALPRDVNSVYVYGLEYEDDFDEGVYFRSARRYDSSAGSWDMTRTHTDLEFFRNVTEGYYSAESEDDLRYSIPKELKNSLTPPRAMARFVYKDGFDVEHTADLTGTVRVLDHITIDPVEKYLPGFAWVDAATVSPSGNGDAYRVFAYFTDGTSSEISLDPAVTWTTQQASFKHDGKNFRANADRFDVVNYPNRVKHKRWQVSDDVSSRSDYAGNADDPSTWVDREILVVSYTLAGVIKDASVMGTLREILPVSNISVRPNPANVYAGNIYDHFDATASYSNSLLTKDVTNEATCVWSCGSLATSQGGGRFLAGWTAGTETVTATYTSAGETKSGSATLNIIGAQSMELQYKNDADEWVTGDQTTFKGRVQQYRIRVKYTDGHFVNFTDGFTLTSSNPGVLFVRGVGTEAVAPGTSTITASMGGQTTNGIKFTVLDNAFTYAIVIDPEGNDRTTTQSSSYGWDERFKAVLWTLDKYYETRQDHPVKVYKMRYDNGVLDVSYGNGGRVDVSSSCTWNISWDNLSGVTQTYQWSNASHVFTIYKDDRYANRYLHPTAIVTASFIGDADVDAQTLGLNIAVSIVDTTPSEDGYRVVVYVNGKSNVDEDPVVVSRNSSDNSLTARLEYGSGSSWGDRGDVTNNVTFNVDGAGWSVSGTTLTAPNADANASVGGTYSGSYSVNAVIPANVSTVGGGQYYPWIFDGLRIINGNGVDVTGETIEHEYDGGDTYTVQFGYHTDAVPTTNWMNVTGGGGHGWSVSPSGYCTYGTEIPSTNVTNKNSSDHDQDVTLTASIAQHNMTNIQIPAGSVSVTLRLKKNSSVTPPSKYINLSPASYEWNWDETDERTITVQSNTSWTLSVPSGFTASKTSGTGDDTFTIRPTGQNSSATDIQVTLFAAATDDSSISDNVSLTHLHKPVATYTYRLQAYVNPSTISIGGTSSLSAKLFTTTFLDGVSQGEDAGQDVSASFSSGNTSYVTINNSSAMATGVAAGSSVISASYSGTETGETTVNSTNNPSITVMEKTIVSIDVTGGGLIVPSASSSTTEQFTAIVHFSDNTTETSTSSSNFTWSVSSSAYAGNYSINSSTGLLTVIALPSRESGTVTCAYSSTYGSISGTANFDIDDPIVSIENLTEATDDVEYWHVDPRFKVTFTSGQTETVYVQRTNNAFTTISVNVLRPGTNSCNIYAQIQHNVETTVYPLAPGASPTYTGWTECTVGAQDDSYHSIQVGNAIQIRVNCQADWGGITVTEWTSYNYTSHLGLPRPD